MLELASRQSPGDAVDPVSSGWLAAALGMIESHGVVVRASLIEVRGSAPREPGAAMLITANDIVGTIGGGSLEFKVMATARKLMMDYSDGDASSASWQRQLIKAALGPDMGQCCGGQVRVLLERFGLAEFDDLQALAAGRTENMTLQILHPLASGPPLTIVPHGMATGLSSDKASFIAPLAEPKAPVFLYGAGHVGRALVGHLVALELDVHWVDVASERFPSERPSCARRIIATDPATIAKHAPAGAIHLVITHDHALDEAICFQLLRDDQFARLGLIGSSTKAARFRSRLAKAGISEQALNRLVCPVGLATITGKAPARVALSIAAAVAIWQQEIAVETNNSAVFALEK